MGGKGKEGFVVDLTLRTPLWARKWVWILRYAQNDTVEGDCHVAMLLALTKGERTTPLRYPSLGSG